MSTAELYQFFESATLAYSNGDIDEKEYTRRMKLHAKYAAKLGKDWEALPR